MKEPNVQLKNVKTFEGHEGLGINADVWINGLKCMHLYDSAMGGEYEYTYFTYNNPKAGQVRENIALLEAYIKTLPPEVTIMNDREFTLDVDMDMFLNEIYEKMQMEKKMKKSILVGVPNATVYEVYGWKNTPLANIPVPSLQKAVDDLKSQCTGGKVILNTNLETLGVTL